MKKFKLNQTSLSAFLGVALSLFLTAPGFASIPIMSPWGGTLAMPKAMPLQQPPIVSTLIQTLAFPKVERVASKKIWVGGDSLIFEVEGRESLRTTTMPLIQFSSLKLEGVKKILMRAFLVALMQEKTTSPLRSDLTGQSIFRRFA